MSAGADLEELAWPLSRAHELLDALGTESRLRPTRAARPPGASALRDTATFAAWLQASARWAGLEIEPTVLPMADLPTLVRGAAPLVLGWGDGLLALAGTTPRGRVRLVGPDGRVATVAAARVLRALRRHAEAGVAPQVDAMLERAGLTGRRRAHARDRLLDRRLAAQQLGPVWLLRPSAHADYLTRARRWGLGRLLLGLLGLTVASQLLLLGAWTLVGRGALSGRLDGGWMLGWALLLLSAVPVDTTRDWIASLLGVRLGAQLKQRLLVGALRMAPEQIRHEGVGGLLGRVIESQAVELLALNGGLTVVLAVVQLAIAGAALGPGRRRRRGSPRRRPAPHATGSTGR